MDPEHADHPPGDLPPGDPVPEADLDRELADGEGVLAGDLRALLAPGAGIGRRTADSVDRTLRARSGGATALSLLGVGWQTMRLLLSDDPVRADREGAGRDGPPGRSATGTTTATRARADEEDAR